MRLVLLSLVLALAACDKTPNTNTNAKSNNDPANNVTPVNADNTLTMLPIELQQTMQENCISCHSPGGIAPFDFTVAETVVSLGELIANAVTSRQMPPWNMDPTCTDLKGDLRLTDAQIQIFTDWVADGKPLVAQAEFEHGIAKNPEIGDPPSEDDDVVELMIPDAYEPVFGRADGYEEDDFRCFPVDPGFTMDRQMTGFEVLVDNPELAHHMVVYMADGSAEGRANLAALEAEDDQPGFTCFALSRFDVTGLAAAWAPGGGRVGFPRQQGIGQTGVPVDGDTMFVLQMHYNKATQNAGTDQSGIRMWFRPEDQPVHELAEAYWTFVGNEPFRVPAGVDGTMVPDEQCDIVYNTYALDDDDTPISFPTAGYHGKEVSCGIRVEDCEATNGAGAAECAIDYSSQLRVTSMDPAATYTVTILDTAITVDATAIGATSELEVVTALVDAINAEPAVNTMVAATLRDSNSDGTMDELVVSNIDGASVVRTREFVATGSASVRTRLADGCAQWDPARLVEARGVGASGCVQTEIYYRNPAALKIWAAFTHMHYIGQRIEIDIAPSNDDGVVSARATEPDCLARTNSWDFDWQRTYWLEEPARLPRNGVATVRCRYDTSESGEEVRLGDGSGSEMCLGLLYLSL